MIEEAPINDNPPEPAPLRPSIPLIVVSVVVMLIGAATVSMAMVVIELLWPSALSYSMLLMLGIGLATMLGQYFGTFRGSVQGAGIATGGSLSCFTILYVVLLVLRIYAVDWTQPDAWVTSPQEHLIIWPIITIVSLLAAVLNGRWTWKLRKQTENSPSRPLSISLREIMAFCAVLGLMMIPASYRANANQSLYRANVAVADAPITVPENAQAIQYERDRNGQLLVSYKIDETSLRTWLSSRDSPFRQYRGEWKEIASPVDVHIPDPNRVPLPISFGNHQVTHGLAVYWKTDTLHHIITYDRATGTAYYRELAISE